MKSQNRKKVLNSPKKIAATQRRIDIAKGKGDKLRDILKYGVTESSIFYDGNVIAKIIEELHNVLPEQSILHDLGGTKMDDTCVIIDFMAVLRLI